MVMKACGLFLLLGALASSEAAGTGNKGYYRAAVVDFPPREPYTRENMLATVKSLEVHIQKANVHKADIIVFPEEALGMTREISVAVPDPAKKITPEAKDKYDESLHILSKYARTYQIYVVVNVVENATLANNKTVWYNTNIVFDRNGAVHDRYRKYNLFEEAFNITDEKTAGYFSTDFNVNFGHMIGTDILFKKPVLDSRKTNNLTNFVYPNKWFSEMPFLTSVQTQWMWSVGLDVNILAAGLRMNQNGNAGSGIYRGRSGPRLYTMNQMVTSTLLIGDVSIENGKNSGLGDVVDTTVTPVKVPIKLEKQPELSSGKFVDILMPTNTTDASKTLSTHFVKNICDGDLCCSFDVQLTYDNRNVTGVVYKAMVLNGRRIFDSKAGKKGIQICGVVSCSTTNVTSCGQITMDTLTTDPVTKVVFGASKISGNFEQKDSSILPNVLLWPGPKNEFLIEPSAVNFTSSDSDGHTDLSFDPKQQIVTFAIHSRVFSRDNGSSGLQISALVVCFSVLLPLLTPYLRL